MKIAAVSIALLSASKSVDARIGSKAAVPFFKLIQDDGICKTELDAAIAKCTQVKADKCGACFDNAEEDDYVPDEDKMCVNLPACVKDTCKGCQHEIKEAFNCHLKPYGASVCAADFAAMLGSNFLQGKDDEECKAEADAATAKCTQVKADKCGECFETATKEDYGFDEAKKCVTLPACVKDECSGCQHEVKEAFNCGMKAGGLDATACAAENASFDFAAALRSNFLQGQDDEKCAAEGAAAAKKCKMVPSAAECLTCFADGMTSDDFKCDPAKNCITPPPCVTENCHGCQHELKTYFNCHAKDDEEAAACGGAMCSSEAVSAVF